MLVVLDLLRFSSGYGHKASNQFVLGRDDVIHWKQIAEYIEPNWEKVNSERSPAVLFWRGAKGAVFGHIRDGELFDHKWVYVCDSNKVTHFSEVNGPENNIVEMSDFRS